MTGMTMSWLLKPISNPVSDSRMLLLPELSIDRLMGLIDRFTATHITFVLLLFVFGFGICASCDSVGIDKYSLWPYTSDNKRDVNVQLDNVA